MTTRAANIQFLLSGLTSATTGLPVEDGTVYFYSAGTSDAKYVWTEKAKTNGFYSYTLDGIGAAQLFGEGAYDIVVKASDGSTIDTLYDIRLEHPYYGISSESASPVTQVSQDDLYLVDTTSEEITINLMAAASWTRPLIIQHTAGANNIVVDPNGSETIDSSATLTFKNAVVQLVSDGSNILSVGFRSAVADQDNDTKIQVEAKSDEDVIRFTAGGNANLAIYSSGPYNIYSSGSISMVSGDLYVSAGSVYVPAGGLTVTDGNGIFTAGDLYVSAGGVVIGGTLDVGSTATKRVASTGTFANLATGEPVISNTAFVPTTSVTETQWWAVYPSGASPVETHTSSTVVWAALASVPTDADWIEVKGSVRATHTASSTVNFISILKARKNGASTTNTSTNLAQVEKWIINTEKDHVIVPFGSVKIPVLNRSFDIYWDSSFTEANIIYMYLTGWGFNP